VVVGDSPPVDIALMGIPYIAKAILNCFGLGVFTVVKVYENGRNLFCKGRFGNLEGARI
jgi:hypothetical protein